MFGLGALEWFIVLILLIMLKAGVDTWRNFKPKKVRAMDISAWNCAHCGEMCGKPKSEMMSGVPPKALAKCRYCAMDIPHEAKYCPHCRKKLRGIGTGTAILLSLFAIIGLVFTLFVYGSWLQYKERQAVLRGESKPTATPRYEVPLTKKGEKIKAKHEDWPNDVCNAIAEKKVQMGMSGEQVQAAWGKPERINSSTYSYAGQTLVKEQWVYGDTYLYIENDSLTSWQESK